MEKITPAGSLRRGRETVGDLDILVTGKCCCAETDRQKADRSTWSQFPGLMEIIASGENKVSFRLRSGMQVDVRLLPPESFGAAMQYFTGSKAHNVALRQRALKMGYTLNEYSLAHLEDEKPVAGKTEEEIYAKLKLDFIPPEMRENLGEIDAAEKHALPALVTPERPARRRAHAHRRNRRPQHHRGDGRGGAARGYKYMAITDHSKNLAFANGLDDKRALAAHRSESAPPTKKIEGISIFAGIEVDILADGDARSLRLRARADGPRDRQRALALQSGPRQDDRASAARRSRIRTLRSSAIPPDASCSGATLIRSISTPFSKRRPSTKSRWS